MQALGEAVGSIRQSRIDSPSDSARLRPFEAIVRDYLPHVYRLLRHLGVPKCDTDDATQQVFLVLSRKFTEISFGSERAFLSSVAVRIASRWRRTHQRRRESSGDEPLSQLLAIGPSPERQLERAEAEHLLLEVLDALPDKLRAPFVLFEIEELTIKEISETLELPQGTVASRLRSARQQFHKAVAELDASASSRRLP